MASFFPGKPVLGGMAGYSYSGFSKSAQVSMATIIARYETLINRLRGITPTALRDAMTPVFNKSQVYVPKKTGALMDSGELNVYPLAGDVASAEIVYGNEEAWYAALIHEAVWLNHAAPTRAKYLQNAMEEEFDAFLSSVAADYGPAMGS